MRLKNPMRSQRPLRTRNSVAEMMMKKKRRRAATRRKRRRKLTS